MPVVPSQSQSSPVGGSPTLTPFSAIPISGYTNEALITYLYGSLGLSNILDDLDNTVDGSDGITDFERVINQSIRDAEQTINIRLNQYFNANDMLGDPWIESRATHLAAFYISRRRGNEHYFQDVYEDAIRELDAIATGELPPPIGIPLNAYTYPSMSNLLIDEKFSVSKIRVRQEISVGGTYPNQQIAFGYFWGWV